MRRRRGSILTHLALRGSLVLAILGLAGPACHPIPESSAQGAVGRPHVSGQSGVERLRITSGDGEGLASFLESVLDFRRIRVVNYDASEVAREFGVGDRCAKGILLRLGEEEIELVQFDGPPGRIISPDARGNDRSFQHIAIITSDMDAAYARLTSAGVRFVSDGPQTLPASNRAAAGIRAFYFRDAEGHFLEVLQFPPDKGAARWHVAGGAHPALFLGIDHTAITVADTDRSVAFYRDAFNLRVVGESLNEGIEQERLSGVRGARVRITALRGDAGPGVELLEYLEPRDGRPGSPDASATDLAYWQIVFLSGRTAVPSDPDLHAVLSLDPR